MFNEKNTDVQQPSFSRRQNPSSVGKNDNVVFIICLVIAFIFWGLIKLSDFYDVSYDYKISYSNIPVEKRLTRLIDSTANVSFSGRGFVVLRLNLFEEMNELNIDFEDCDMISNEGDIYEISTDELKEQLAEKLGLLASEIEFSKDALGFVLEDLQEKQIEVTSKLNLSFDQQYDLYKPATLSPKVVKVYGPKNILDTMTKVSTQNMQLVNLHADQTVTAKLQNPYPKLLRFDPEEIEIGLHVEKFTESSLELPIDFSSIKENIKSFPSSVKVHFKVAQKDFNNIQAGQFLVVPDANGINLNETDKIHLTLTTKPEFIRNEWIVPTNVEFLIIK